jgi:hypothetical protein
MVTLILFESADAAVTLTAIWMILRTKSPRPARKHSSRPVPSRYAADAEVSAVLKQMDNRPRGVTGVTGVPERDPGAVDGVTYPTASWSRPAV